MKTPKTSQASTATTTILPEDSDLPNIKAERMIRVLIADDNASVRIAIARLLVGDPQIQIVGEADCFNQTMDLTKEVRPDVIILDLHMDKGHDPSTVREHLSGSRVVAVCLWNDAETHALAESFGAAVLLNKGDLSADLIPAIRENRIYLDATAKNRQFADGD